MNELTLDGKIYITSKRAAEISGYAKDYIGQLCREGRVEARLVGRNWYVLREAIEKRQFEGAEEGTAAEVATETTNQPQEVRYESEEVSSFPLHDELVLPRQENDINTSDLSETVANPDQAWSDWFELEPKLAAEPVPAHAQELIEHEEIAEGPLIEEENAPQIVNLRKIRDFKPLQEADFEESKPEIVAAAVSGPIRYGHRSKKWLYQAIQGGSILVALAAFLLAAIGTGYLEFPILHAEGLAGVAAYTKSAK